MGYPHHSTECKDHHELVRDFGGDRPQIVVLCGSTRFAEHFAQQRAQATLDGKIVLGPEIMVRSNPAYSDLKDGKGKELLDELHKRKIDLADYILVLNVGGYIGDSTRSEIEYAESINCPVVYLEDQEELT